MFGLFKKKTTKVVPGKDQTIAFDHGYFTHYTATDEKIKHHLTWVKNEFTGQRKLKYNSSAERHAGIMKAKILWEEYNKIRMSNDGELFDLDYILTSNSPNSKEYEYKPLTDYERIMMTLEKIFL